jgi:hypothetical protein
MKYRHTTTAFLLLLGSHIALFAQQYNPPNDEAEFERQYQERIKKDRLNGVYIPRNLDDVLVQLNKLTSEEARQKFRAIPEDAVCKVMHNRLGQWMIANWSFYEGSRLSNYLRSAGVTYPDDMADFLILAYHRHLNGHPVSIKELAVYFREKRQQEWEQRQNQGDVLKEEVRKRPKPEGTETPAPAPEKPAALPAKSTSKRGTGKQ